MSLDIETTRPVEQTPRRRAPRQAWLVLLTVIVVAYLADSLQPYLSMEPASARIVLRPGVWLHYPVLIVHIAAGTVALLTLCLQVWPYLRRTRPRVHALVGRTYVFAGALPAAATALVLMPLTNGWSGNVGITAHAVLWFATTVLGWRAARAGRWADHRRWMLYSAALALGILWGRAAVLVYLALGGPFDVDIVFEVARWAGWMINLIAVQWWLERSARPLPA